nr:hypothetical protein [Bradyrhizobium sp. CCBAU 53380]
MSEQSRALLDSWIPKLCTYVPTKSHRDAVNAISDHGIVLSLPLKRKISNWRDRLTIASENPANTVLASTSPRDFEAGWNPNDPGRFFWIDDAFSSNVLRDYYVQDWASAFQAAGRDQARQPLSPDVSQTHLRSGEAAARTTQPCSIRRR